LLGRARRGRTEEPAVEVAVGFAVEPVVVIDAIVLDPGYADLGPAVGADVATWVGFAAATGTVVVSTGTAARTDVAPTPVGGVSGLRGRSAKCDGLTQRLVPHV
jgi:hypothetical protein